ncbi:MAG: hypothetical protein LBS06_07225 [Treponema sp.]|jgi:hypothetical protein|nr:hypothetical protein [Treponema sp.]
MFSQVKNLMIRGLHSLAGKTERLFRLPRRPVTPLADRLLADALRLAELPSPVPGEEPRSLFVLDRLKRCGFVPAVTKSGNIVVRLHAEGAPEEPVLLFTDLGSLRWHPTESLARLDAENAAGAGLGDSLGPAALLSVAENFYSGEFRKKRDLVLLFTVRMLDDPENNFPALITGPARRPVAAIGVRGLSLGTLVYPTGFCRLGVQVSTDQPEPANEVTQTLIKTARTILEIRWDGEGKTKVFVRRIEAAAAWGRTPAGGILELEIESDEGNLLELAKNAITATAAKIGEDARLKVETTLLSFVPPGDRETGKPLFDLALKILKEQRIRTSTENGADPASLFGAGGIPALSVGIALGREGAERDLIQIGSVETGRRFLERFIGEIE